MSHRIIDNPVTVVYGSAPEGADLPLCIPVAGELRFFFSRHLQTHVHILGARTYVKLTTHDDHCSPVPRLWRSVYYDPFSFPDLKELGVCPQRRPHLPNPFV